MKILWVWQSIVEPNRECSGSDSHNRGFKDALVALGHEVVELSFRDDKARDDRLRRHRTAYSFAQSFLPQFVCAFLRDSYSIYSDRACRGRLANALRILQPDCVYERFSEFHNGAGVVRHAGIPYVLEIHSTVQERRGFSTHFNGVYRRRQIKAARAADLLVVVSEVLKKYFVEHGVSADRVLVLPNAVAPHFCFPNISGRDVRNRFHLGSHPVVGFVGTNQAFHGTKLIVDACDLLLPHFPDIRFLVVGPFGDESMRSELIAEATARGILDHVLLTGAVDRGDVPNYVQAMDVCIMPDSNSYGSPLKLFEYGALAKPSVFPRYPPIEEVVQHGKHVLLFEPRRVDQMVACIMELLRSQDLRMELGRNLRAKVLAAHTWEQNAQRVLAKMKGSISRNDSFRSARRAG